MSEEQLITYCSPTLAGIKTGNLFRCKFEDKKRFFDDIRAWNRILVPRGVRIIPIQLSHCYALVYVYRPSKLQKDLDDSEATQLLCEFGYKAPDINCCVSRLCKRLVCGSSGADFPHEIGLFLGYPPADVRGFIENDAKGYKLLGFWKVYDDTQEAIKKFELYKKCERIYKKQWSEGKSINRLTVAERYK